MKFYSHCVGLMLVATTAVATTAAANDTPKTLMDRVEVVGFECAEKSLSMLGYLGRGTQFPEFLIVDIDKELKRQDSRSELLKVECTGEPELKAASVPVEGDPSKNMLSSLSMTFPVNVEVRNGNTIINLKVEHNYSVQGLHDSDVPKLNQNFVVKR
jgi:hypothetical protein